MIRGLVDFALNKRFLVLAMAVLLFVRGAIGIRTELIPRRAVASATATGAPN